MSYNNGKITAPVSIHDIQRCLGTDDNDLAKLCKNPNINMWSKRKPIGLRKKETLTASDFEDAKYGLSPFSTASFANIISNTIGNANGWNYSKPLGGQLSPYRITDFDGYNHNAMRISNSFGCTTEVAQGQQFSASCIIPSDDGDNVTFASFQGMYFGCAIINANNQIVCKGTSAITGTSYVHYDIPVEVENGDYRAIPFLCNNIIPVSTGSISGSNTFWTVPYCRNGLVTIGASALISVKAIWTDSSHTSINVEVHNLSAEERTYTIYIMRNGREWTDVRYDDEKRAFGSVSSHGTTTTTVSGMTGSNYHCTVVLANGLPRVYDTAIMGTIGGFN